MFKSEEKDNNGYYFHKMQIPSYPSRKVIIPKPLWL